MLASMRGTGSRLPSVFIARPAEASATSPRYWLHDVAFLPSFTFDAPTSETKALRRRWHYAVGLRGRICPNGKTRRLKETGSRWRASPRRCRAFSLRRFYRGRSAAHSCRRHLASRSMNIGARIQFEPIAWHARLPPAAARPVAGPGG